MSLTEEEMNETCKEFLATIELKLLCLADDPDKTDDGIRERVKTIALYIQTYLNEKCKQEE